jgi:hypothetical protein
MTSSSFAHTTATSAIGDRRIGDPHLGAVETVPIRFFHGLRHHAARVGAVIRFGETETSHELSGCQLGQVFSPRVFAAIGVDRMHDERGLHAHRGAIAGVDALDLARQEPVADIAESGTAILFRQSRAEHAERTHLRHDGAVERFIAKAELDAAHELVLAIVARAVSNHAFLGREFMLDQQRIGPVERIAVQLGGGLGVVVFNGAHDSTREKRLPVDLVGRRRPASARHLRIFCQWVGEFSPATADTAPAGVM